MNRKLLDLTPMRYLCPYCGEWHEWEGYRLGYYDSSGHTAEFNCPNIPREGHQGCYQIFFSGDYLYYSTKSICRRAGLVLEGKIEVNSIIEHSDEPIVTFCVEFSADRYVGGHECRDCPYCSRCNCVKLCNKAASHHISITLGFEFDQEEYDEIVKAATLECKERELEERENAVKSKEKSLQERENVLESKELNKHAEQPAKIKEDKTTMANNILNMNIEFGPNKDENIASTLMGVAVKNGDSWRIYDKKKKEITDVGDMQLGNFPIFILPTTKLNVGDLIKDDGEYYFVSQITKENTKTLSAKTGEIKTVIPVKNVLGINCYSKVIALTDSFNMGSDMDVEKLAIMSAMCGQSGEAGDQMNQMLPLMLFKDKLGSDDDTMKMILMSSMMSAPTEGGDQNAAMNQLLPFMLLKENEGGDDEMMKMVLMSSMMGGNTAGNNPVMSYMMLDMVMGKKEEKKAKEAK